MRRAKTVTIYALYNTPTMGEHFGAVRSGTWADVVNYLNKTTPIIGPRKLFVQTAERGPILPLMHGAI